MELLVEVGARSKIALRKSLVHFAQHMDACFICRNYNKAWLTAVWDGWASRTQQYGYGNNTEFCELAPSCSVWWAGSLILGASFGCAVSVFPLHFRPRCCLRIGPWGRLGVRKGLLWVYLCGNSFWLGHFLLGFLPWWTTSGILGPRLWRAGPAVEQLVETKQASGMRE